MCAWPGPHGSGRRRERAGEPTRRARTLAAVTGRFYVRTYGCQMNEHDSERIAGVLAAQGMEPSSDLDEADVVVLNTCCIRENADNRLYGQLGHLKALKEERPGRAPAIPRPDLRVSDERARLGAARRAAGRAGARTH